MPEEPRQRDRRDRSGMTYGMSIAFGTMAGMALGAATGNWAIWLPIALAVGTAMGVALGWGTRRNRNR